MGGTITQFAKYGAANSPSNATSAHPQSIPLTSVVMPCWARSNQEDKCALVIGASCKNCCVLSCFRTTHIRYVYTHVHRSSLPVDPKFVSGGLSLCYVINPF